MSRLNLNNFKDKKTWALIQEGLTKGVFQLESNLGRSWAKRVKPENIEELAALISVIRPGTLKAMSEGKSMTQHYVDRKAGIDEVVYLHESLEPILGSTYGILVYQEQSMKIAQTLAGFSLSEADVLRKAIGKKNAALMNQVKEDFIKGAKKVGIVPTDVAEEIFSWIEKSSRYAFNKSHAVSYAFNSFWSAYCKAHRTVEFFRSYLNHSSRKQDSQAEIKELISDAKLYDIEVLPPRLNNFYRNFQEVGRKIYFGYNDIKQVGDSECLKIEAKIEEGCDANNTEFASWSWMDVLVHLAGQINKQASVALISCGAFNGPNCKVSRQKMLYEFDCWKSLTKREQQFIAENYKPTEELSEAVRYMINNHKITSRRLSSVSDILQTLEEPMYSLDDSPVWIAEVEEKYMGAGLTYSRVDASGGHVATDTTCRDILLGKEGKVNLCVQINSAREWTIKSGKNAGNVMCFLCIEDNTGLLDSVIAFTETYEKYQELLHQGNTVMLMGQTSSKKDGGVIVNKVCQI